MEPDQAAGLGALLRSKREAAGMTKRDLGAAVGVNETTILRIENGEFAAPRPDVLARLAEALGLEVADVFALADYVTPTELPTLTPYLRAKYRNLPDDAVESIERYASRLAKRHGVALQGPAPGEDETP